MQEPLDPDNPFYAPFDSSAERLPSAARGQRMVLAVLCAFLSLSFSTIVIYSVSIGLEGLEVRLIRFCFEIILAVGTYKGYAWARYLLGGFAALGLMYGLSEVVTVFRAGMMPLVLVVYMLTIYASVAVILLLSKNANAFFAYQIRNRKG